MRDTSYFLSDTRVEVTGYKCTPIKIVEGHEMASCNEVLTKMLSLFSGCKYEGNPEQNTEYVLVGIIFWALQIIFVHMGFTGA